MGLKDITCCQDLFYVPPISFTPGVVIDVLPSSTFVAVTASFTFASSVTVASSATVASSLGPSWVTASSSFVVANTFRASLLVVSGCGRQADHPSSSWEVTEGLL